MPICEADPWRMQYFEGVNCPDEVRVPTEDCDGYSWFPKHRWVYNKLQVAESQGLTCGPHGVEPPSWPVFSKPIYNLHGMGTGSRVLRRPSDYRHTPGHMWMTLLEGDHVSTDIAVEDGQARWFRHTTGVALPKGMFDYWCVEARARPELEDYCSDWVKRELAGYTGMMNVETIGGRIIEAHLRFADQWPDLYGEGWLDALVRLYAEGRWVYDDANRRDGFSVVLFGAHGVQYQHPPADLVDELRTTADVTSIQITFHADRDPRAHAMPPGGFRLAIVNCRDLDAGRAVREKLALGFWSTQGLLARPRRGRAAASSEA